MAIIGHSSRASPINFIGLPSRESTNIIMFDLFRDFFLAFFRQLKVKFSEQVSRQVATEEPNKGFKKGQAP